MKFLRRLLRLPLAAALVALVWVAGCRAARPPVSPVTPVEVPEPVPEVERADSLVEVLEEELLAVHPDSSLLPPPPFGYWADSVLSTLSLEEKAGQLIMPWMLGDFAPEGSAGRRRILELVEEVGVGGVIISVGSPSEVAVKLNDLQARAGLPLLVAADLETGAGFRFRGAAYLPGPISLGGATDFPSLMALGAAGDATLAYEMGRITGVEARALGVHVPFAPVLDVNNNFINPIINVRSFGEDPAEVARLGRAFVRGVQDAGALATGKHFPGHGDTETDSHLELPVINVSRERLEAVELPPFRAAVEEGIAGIMTAHIAVPALTGAAGVPSTLSRAVLTDLLREEMGFQGLVFTDAMDMYAIDRRHGRGEAAVRALEAGADIILMPPDPRAAMNGIVDAVRDGRVPEERLDESVRRLLEAKERMGLHRERMVPVQEVFRAVGIRAHEEVAQEVAHRSITLLRNEGSLLPLLGTRTAQVLSVSFRRPTDLMAGRAFNAALRARYPRLATVETDRNTPGDVYTNLLRRARSSNLVVVSLYVTAVSYSGSVAIPDQTAEFIRRLAREGVPHVVISFGNPYLLVEFPDVRAYLLAWSGTDASQRAAARALFGDIAIQGRTPTRIPPIFQVGDGIQLPARQGMREN
jgi:beta-N-acetylhexosaminidase